MNRRGGGGRADGVHSRSRPSSSSPPSSGGRGGGGGGGMSFYAFFALVIVLASVGSTIMMMTMMHLRHHEDDDGHHGPGPGRGPTNDDYSAEEETSVAYAKGMTSRGTEGGGTKKTEETTVPPFLIDPRLPWHDALSFSSRYLDPSSNSHHLTTVVHYLPVIPHRRRTPSDQRHNLTHFLESMRLPDEEDRPLYLYNPTLLPLSNLSDELKRSVVGEAGESTTEAAYAATFRVSNFANCFGPGRGVPPTYRNYLGLALLDSNLKIIGGTDVVIDLNENLRKKEGGDSKRRQRLEDCQLVGLGLGDDGAKGNRKRGALYVLCNSYLLPVSLRRNSGGEAGHHVEASEGSPPYLTFENTYGTGMTLSLLRPMIFLGGNRKNMHIFETSSAGSDPNDAARRTYLEIWPSGPHEVDESITAVTPDTDPSFRPMTLPPGLAGIEEEDEKSDTFKAKFPILSQLGHVLTKRDSGSACCVPILYRNRQLLMGVSHRKTRRGLRNVPIYQYLSRLYAFDPDPETGFDVVARSDVFCLGFGPPNVTTTSSGEGSVAETVADTDSAGGDGEIANPNVDQGREYYLKILDGMGVERCPSIHFVSGITDKVDDDDGMVILSYGVNDCYPRMVEVGKGRLVAMLRPVGDGTGTT